MMTRNLILFIALILTLTAYSQIEFSGIVVDEKGEILIGANISEISTKTKSISNLEGKFRINLQSNLSKIQIEYIGHEKLIVKVDTVNKTDYKAILKEKNNLDDLVIIAPCPRGFGVGYYGLTSNQPIGIKLNYWTQAGEFRSYLNYATIDFKSNFYDYEIGPYGLSYYGLGKYFSPYLKGIILQNDNVIKSKTLFCDRISFSSIEFHAGLGYETASNMPGRIIFLSGLKKYLNLPINPFFSSSIACDFFFNGYSLDYMSALNVELYNRNYKIISISVGYQSIFNQKDITLNLSYKYYYIGRNKKK